MKMIRIIGFGEAWKEEIHVRTFPMALILLVLSAGWVSAQKIEGPASLNATPGPDGRIFLSWDAVPGASGYNIYRAVFQDFPLEDRFLIKPPSYISRTTTPTTTKTKWVDGDPFEIPSSQTFDGTRYYYLVTAVVGGVESAPSPLGSAVADKTMPRIENISVSPNPFVPEIHKSVSIKFTLTEPSKVQLDIRDPETGAVLRRLISGDLMKAGDNIVFWDGKDSTLSPLPPGSYVYSFSGTVDLAGNRIPEDVIGILAGGVLRISKPIGLSIVEVAPNPFSPDGDNIKDKVLIDYYLDKPVQYVSINIFSPTGAKVAQVMVQRYEYTWSDTEKKWVEEPYKGDGIPAGFSFENYYLKPLNPTNPVGPPYGGAVYEKYPKAVNYSAKRTQIVDLDIIDPAEIPPGVTREQWKEQWKNWFPFVFTIPWDGTGAVGPGNYTFTLQAMSSSGDVSIMMTREVTIESISVVPSDRSAPIVLETMPSGGEWTMPLTKVSATLSDGAGVGVDLAKSSIRLLGPKGLVPGEQTNDGFGRIEWNISPSLSPFGADDGDYTILVDPVDLLGNKLPQPISVSFKYNAKVNDKIPPRLVSVSPQDKAEVLEPISYISVVVRDDLAGPGSGVDLIRTSVTVKGPSGPIYGVKYGIGEDTIRFEFSPPLPADGSADGLYSIEVLPVDKAGNSPEKPYISTFIYHTAPDSQPPIVLGSEPKDGTALKELKILKIFIKDMPDVEWLASGIDLEASTLRLIDPYGRDVQGVKRLEADGISFLPSYPLQNDGIYSILVQAVDKRGNKGPEARYSFIYDTSPPRLTSISIANGSYIRDFPGEISAIFSDGLGSGIDPASLSISLIGPKGKIGGTLKAALQDKGSISISFAPAPVPSDPGDYTLSLSISDLLGNSSKEEVSFTLDNVSLISVSSITPSNGARLNISSFPVDKSGKPQITVSLDLRGDTFSPTGSYISVTDPDGNPVQGVKAIEAGPNIRFTMTSPLKEGRYKVVVGCADSLGNVAIYEFSFFIDNTSLARIRSSDPQSGLSTNKQISKIIVDIDTRDDFDPGSISTKDVISVFRGDKKLSGRQGLEGPDRIYFSLDKPLATDGTEDGTYEVRVTLYDMAGNAGGDKVGPDGIPYYSIVFTYDTRPPRMKGVRFVDPDGMEFEAEAGEMITRIIKAVKVEIEDELSGVDIRRSAIEISGPAPQRKVGDDGRKTLMMEFYPALIMGGRYILKLTAYDMAGNASPVLEFPFTYKDMSPAVSLSMPKEGEVVREIGPISVSISVPSGKGISEKGTIATISGPAGKDIPCEVKVVGAMPQEAKLLLIPKGEAWPDGEYTIELIPMDGMGIEGKEWSLKFVLDGTGPGATFVEPGDGSVLRSPPSRIRVDLFDRSGVEMKGSLISLHSEDGAVIAKASGRTYLEEELKGIVWKKGGYLIKVEAADSVGNASTLLFRFSFDPYPPEIISVYPSDKAILKDQIGAVRISFVDRSGQGIDLEGSSVDVRREDGVKLSGKLSLDGGDLLFSFDKPLATYGADDGIYRISVLLKDKAGGERSFESRFTFDTTPPKIVETSHRDGDAVYVSLTEVWARISDELSGVDLAKSTISLSGPEAVVGKQSNDGRDKLIFSFPSPRESGRYSLTIDPVDKAGNSPPKPISIWITFVGPSSIAADSGGVVKNADGDPVITIPAGALARDVVIAIAPARPPVSGGLIPIGEAYDIVLGAGTELRKPAEVTLRYKESDLDVNGDGIPDLDEGRLAIYRWDEKAGSWVRLTSKVEKGTRSVTADVLFLASRYAIIYDRTIPLVEAGKIIAAFDCSRVFSPNGDGVEDVAAISYAIGRPASRVRLTVSTLSGTIIWSYEEKGKAGPGWYKAAWDGRDWNGNRARSGAYVLRLTVWGEDGVVETRSRPVAVIR
jgi:flagellar hook assembly protein FlgD